MSVLALHSHSALAQAHYDAYPAYQGNDLGITHEGGETVFRIWSPTAEKAELLLFKEAEKGYPVRVIALNKGTNGTWHTKVKENITGFYYAFKVHINHQWSHEFADPYARAVGINGKRGAIIDWATTDPSGWKEDCAPKFSSHNLATDAVIYELHIRDASIDSSSGIVAKGKFTGLTEAGSNYHGLTTGITHLKQLGVTHIHLLPVFDFQSINEHTDQKPKYNWGYDPLNYNVPEGSYSTDPYNPATRIREFKQLVQAMHQNGLRVVMDVVYNHTGLTAKSNFNLMVPGYFYRHKPGGGFSDASGCGNETASERAMMRKFMKESVAYWVKEYHIDGFRFDLMGIHDMETMNEIAETLHAIKPDILLYGEGWTAGQSPLPDSLRAIKNQVAQLNKIAVFSDDLRDAIKGSVFDVADIGFVSGKSSAANALKGGIVASCKHPQVQGAASFATDPSQIISYCECHDNHTLWDKISLSNPGVPEATRRKMHQLALTIVLTSQGIPFLHAGTEFYRSKKEVENSYQSPDSINGIDWSLKETHHELVKYITALIDIRKHHPVFRLTSAESIAKHLRFHDNAPDGTVIYSLDGEAIKDSWKEIWIAFNGTNTEKTCSLPNGNWLPALTMFTAEKQYFGALKLPAYSSAILYR
jgi:pullulanase